MNQGLWIGAASLLGLAGLLAGRLLATNAGAGAAAPAPLDGVLLVTIDTLRADHVGADGGPVATPALDRLAREGALLERAFTPTPSTGPAHASLLTGLHPWHHGALDNAVPLTESVETLAEALRARGVQTAAFVSSYILHPRWRFGQGFETYAFQPSESYVWRGVLRPGFWSRGEATTASALAWLARNAGPKQRPFLLWVHYFDPHRPYRPPPAYVLPQSAVVDLAGKRVPPGVRGPEQLRRLIRRYRGEVRYADAQLARLLGGLERHGRLGRTAVIVTSDHGEGLGDHGVLEHGVNLYEELVRVPLLVRAPDIAPGRRLDGLAQLEDLYPTILSLLGHPLAVPDSVDGVDLLPWLRGRVAASPRRAVVGRRKELQGRAALFYQRGLADKWIGALSRHGAHFQLERDPAERDGVRGDGAPAWLRTQTARAAPEAPLATESDEETRRALRALGYAP